MTSGRRGPPVGLVQRAIEVAGVGARRVTAELGRCSADAGAGSPQGWAQGAARLGARCRAGSRLGCLARPRRDRGARGRSARRAGRRQRRERIGGEGSIGATTAWGRE
jgi:hypothetical protein